MRTKLALEIPLKYWEEFEQYCDFHFALAHEVLENEAYAQRYNEITDKEIYLDNSFNELGHSLNVTDLIRACNKITPTHVFAPEDFNIKEHLRLLEVFKSSNRTPNKVMTTWKGRFSDFTDIRQTGNIVGLPYDLNRWRITNFYDSRKFHYLGFVSLRELRVKPPMSIDTSYPIKLALEGISLSDVEFDERPELKFYDPNLTMTDEQLKLAHENIKYLKEALR